MAPYIPPRKEEVERYVEEVKKYNSQASLQYLPTDDELRVIIKNCPVCVEGEPTERVEVSGYRNLERIETNTVRGGMALVVAEGLALKAPKIKKTVDKVHMEGWDWLDIIISGASKGKSDDEEEKDKKPGVKPKDKYIRDLIGGRPVFSYPMRAGGFRLRYGRSRNTGFAAAGVQSGHAAHPRQLPCRRHPDEGGAAGQGGRRGAGRHHRRTDGKTD